jgi:5-(carboxyamino)imidazole ribonucleotide mutase
MPRKKTNQKPNQKTSQKKDGSKKQNVKATKTRSATGKAARKPAIRVGVIMGSDSDLKVMKGAIECLKDFGVGHEVRIVSAHRTPVDMLEYAMEADGRGLEVIIAGAGGAAHLPGMVASATLLPVIGVPVHITKMDGLDALLSVVQMPKGVPVATVAIDNAYNAGLLAVRILANSDFSLKAALGVYRNLQMKKVRDANRRMNK